MTRAALYIRVSTDEQATEGVSLDAQRAALVAYCAMRGLEVVEVVTDAGVSAGKALRKRAGGRRVLELVEGGEVSAVIAWKLDRLFRDCADCLNVTRGWDSAGVALHLVDLGGQTIDTSTAMGRFFLTVMAGAAELERGLVRERTRAALAHKRAVGEVYRGIGNAPIGHRAAGDGVTLVEDPREARAVEIIRELRAAGVSIRAIADRLNAENVPARGERWHATTVARFVTRLAA